MTRSKRLIRSIEPNRSNKIEYHCKFNIKMPFQSTRLKQLWPPLIQIKYFTVVSMVTVTLGC